MGDRGKARKVPGSTTAALLPAGSTRRWTSPLERRRTEKTHLRTNSAGMWPRKASREDVRVPGQRNVNHAVAPGEPTVDGAWCCPWPLPRPASSAPQAALRRARPVAISDAGQITKRTNPSGGARKPMPRAMNQPHRSAVKYASISSTSPPYHRCLTFTQPSHGAWPGGGGAALHRAVV